MSENGNSLSQSDFSSLETLGGSNSNEMDSEVLVRNDYSSEQDLEYDAHLVLLRKQVDHKQKIL